MTYSSFRKYPYVTKGTRVSDYSFLLDMSYIETEELSNTWKNIKETNIKIAKENRIAEENNIYSLLSDLVKHGICLGTTKRDGNIKYYAHIKKLIKEVSRAVTDAYEPRMIDGSYECILVYKGEKLNISNHLSKLRYTGTFSDAKRVIDKLISNGHLDKMINSNKLTEREEEAKKYLISNGIALDYKRLISKANEVKADRIIDSMVGEEIDIDDNLCECARYVVGDRRCVCGNVRIELIVESEFDDESAAYYYASTY